MTAWPRLMRERTARRYLDGLDPAADLGVSREWRKGEWYYDRLAIDRALDGKGGLAAAQADDPDLALQAWQQGRGAA